MGVCVQARVCMCVSECVCLLYPSFFIFFPLAFVLVNDLSVVGNAYDLLVYFYFFRFCCRLFLFVVCTLYFMFTAVSYHMFFH